MDFQGYSPQLVDFLKAPRANNNKAWFEANRARFDELVIALSRLSGFDPLRSSVS